MQSEAGNAGMVGGTIIVGLTESVDPAHIPTPMNPSERTLFRNLYEPLVPLHAAGSALPGAIASLSVSRDARVATIDVSEEARLSDGTPLDATDIRLSWIVAERQDRARGRDLPWCWFEGGAQSARVLDARRLAVAFVAGVDETRRFFADPALALADRRPGEAWPVGAGRFRAVAGLDRGARDIACLPNEQIEPAASGAWMRLLFRVRPGSDPRDVHEEGVDVLIVRDRPTLGYFATIPEYQIHPAPCDRLYILLAPAAAPPSEPASGNRPRWRDLITTEVTAGLAHDVTLSDAEAAGALFLAPPASGVCRSIAPDSQAVDAQPRNADAVGAGGAKAAQEGPRLFYRNDDEDARRLGERLAVIAEMSGAGAVRLRAIGLPPDEFDRALASGDEDAFVLGIDYAGATACAQLAGLLHAAPWLARHIESDDGGVLPEDASGGSDHAAGGWNGADGAAASGSEEADAAHLSARFVARGVAIPLVATRANVVARRGLVGLRFDDDGALRFDEAAWSAEVPER